MNIVIPETETMKNVQLYNKGLICAFYNVEIGENKRKRKKQPLV